MDTVVTEDTGAEPGGGALSDDESLGRTRSAPNDQDQFLHNRARWPAGAVPVIDDYYCVAQLGQGGSGVVFKALSLRGELKYVALKLLVCGEEEEEERFRKREVEILKGLNSPHVARYLDSGAAGGTMYLVMELAQGRPLDEYLAANTNSLEEKLAVFQQVCKGVADLHAVGVIHRDLKPKHVIVDDRGWPRIVDFGLSATRSNDWPTRVRNAQTELGSILGTVKYMSPEQAWGGLRQVDHRTDIWALGIMLYEIATDGDHPYARDAVADMAGPDAVLQRIQTELPKKPRIASSRFSQPLETLISRCLAYEPEHRMDSAEALACDLRRCLARRPIRTKRFALSYRLRRVATGLAIHRRFGLWTCTVGAILIFLFAVSLLFGVRWQSSGEDYSPGTRRSLHALTTNGQTARDAVVIVGLTDNSINTVPALAQSLGIPGVTKDIRSWRGVHGRLMERLAPGKPRAVMWDFYFRTPQPGDGAFVKGAQALQEAGVPVILGVHQYTDDSRPDLSHQLYDPIEDFARHGLIVARDMITREGEFVLAVRRSESVFSGLALETFAAVVHPECKIAIDWDQHDLTRTMRLSYRPRVAQADWPHPDRIGLTSVFTASAPRVGTRRGDVLACKAFSLARPERWRKQTISYETLLVADHAEITEQIGGKVVILGDLRTPHMFARRDRHRVRFGMEIINDVPGCYLMADAVAGLMGNRYLASEVPLTASAFVGVTLLAILACAISPRLAANSRFHNTRTRRGVVLALLAVSLGSTLLFILLRSRLGVHAGMFAAAVCLAMAAALTIESSRNRHRERSTAQAVRC